jgi:hypothetical protein
MQTTNQQQIKTLNCRCRKQNPISQNKVDISDQNMHGRNRYQDDHKYVGIVNLNINMIPAAATAARNCHHTMFPKRVDQ